MSIVITDVYLYFYYISITHLSSTCAQLFSIIKILLF
uniref:Uncharacterized protein n=1 Tax=MELD virus sp. TaxID=2834287 RepID=A0A8S5L646_9VIRU|nr:MAG TPA: hypothetical protein [MELD virus sp.]